MNQMEIERILESFSKDYPQSINRNHFNESKLISDVGLQKPL